MLPFAGTAFRLSWKTAFGGMRDIGMPNPVSGGIGRDDAAS